MAESTDALLTYRFRPTCRAVLMLGGLATSVPLGIDSGGASRGRYRFAIILVDGRSVYPW